MTNLVLASGQITNQDESRLPWSSLRTARRCSCEGIGRYAPQHPPPPLPGCSRGDHTIIAESATALARIKAHGK